MARVPRTGSVYKEPPRRSNPQDINLTSSTNFLSLNYSTPPQLPQNYILKMQLTSIAIILFAAMGAIANPIAAEADNLVAREAELSKYGGVGFLSSMFSIAVEMELTYMNYNRNAALSTTPAHT